MPYIILFQRGVRALVKFIRTERYRKLRKGKEVKINIRKERRNENKKCKEE